MSRTSIFPTFFLSGFECSTFVWRDKGRRDLVEETQHRRYAREDYALLRALGIGVSREGIPWPLVEPEPGRYDFSPIDCFLEAMAESQVLPIWDLCHYGYPDGADPFAPDFAERFARYARAAAEYVLPRLKGPQFFTPINEITYFGFMGGEWGWIAPFGRSRPLRHDLRLALAKADLAAVRAIREVDGKARMVHIDPLVHVVAPRDRPDLAEAAAHETYEDTYFVWDVLYGREHPELGGGPEMLDIMGVNCYSFGQMEYRENGPHVALEPGDDRIVTTADLFERAWRRYRRPMIVAETSGLHGGRDEWLRDVVQEALAAVRRGLELHAICLFPAVDMPDWNTGEWLKNGICDVVPENGDLRRVPFQPYVDELRRWQTALKRVHALDEDPLDEPIDLQDIREAAERLPYAADKNWH